MSWLKKIAIRFSKWHTCENCGHLTDWYKSECENCGHDIHS
ncbi:hypothetical protein [Bacillus cereus group sp. TH152-1LC]|nr:hypothetical protein [Bacillus cereus group sp. TH152-1LC]MDA1674594.1 hypothetical protein [Bacillus cereus group sp. TH152-1LC]